MVRSRRLKATGTSRVSCDTAYGSPLSRGRRRVWGISAIHPSARALRLFLQILDARPCEPDVALQMHHRPDGAAAVGAAADARRALLVGIGLPGLLRLSDELVVFLVGGLNQFLQGFRHLGVCFLEQLIS